MTIHAIIAIDDSGGIGFNGGLPWPRIPADMKRFRDLTIGDRKNAVIMGRVTWDSLTTKYQPLPQRLNAVVTRSASDRDLIMGDNKTAACVSVEHALLFASIAENTFVIGGAQIYEAAAPHVERWHITRVAGVHEADTFFTLDLRGFELWSHETLAPNARYECWVRK